MHNDARVLPPSQSVSSSKDDDGNAGCGVTAFHAKYFANALKLRGGNELERLGEALTSAAVDLNPHQVRAALFALKPPLPQGVLLADEVGLGKTIEAGLVLCQLWAERKRKLIVVCPAALRKQWQNELWSKFNLPSEILDARRANELRKAGASNPFSLPKIIVVSYHFAAKNASLLRAIDFDCCVLDEAHKLRYSYREGNRIGQNLRFALDGRKKILLSATPLQNNLSELYGIATLIDDSFFGDLATFRSRYVNAGGDFDDLRARLKDFCFRTLRKDVAPYIKYTSRIPLTIRFNATRAELELYNDISAYLQDESTFAFPPKQRKMLTLLMRKLLASSPAAIAGTLESVLRRLEKLHEKILAAREHADEATPVSSENENDAWIEHILSEESDAVSEIEEDDEDESVYNEDEATVPAPNESEKFSPADLKKLDAEISRVRDLLARARENTEIDSKTHELLSALSQGWKKLAELGVAQKAVIFTESRRSMEFLRTFLEENGYANDVVCFSGGGKRSPREEEIFKEYCEANPCEKNKREVLFRHALIEKFKDDAKILIATEAGAEGINLQFCSLVINFDLPWNPQRVEQRIGRCHRYGQKNDVVVVNFLNVENAADVRVFEILSTKLQLFSGLFGATDEILGAIDSGGASVEQRIFEIFQRCRSDAEIQAAFDALQNELSEQIRRQREATEREILDKLDPQVVERLKFTQNWAEETLPRREREFWKLTKFVLRNHATFDDASLSFVLKTSPFPQIAVPAKFSFKKNAALPPDVIPYRPNSELGELVVSAALVAETPTAELRFDLRGNATRIPVLEKLKGKSGFLRLDKLSLEGLDASEFLLFSAVDKNNASLEAETTERLFELAGTVLPADAFPSEISKKLAENLSLSADSTAQEFDTKNREQFSETNTRLDRWERDALAVAEKKIEVAKAHEREVRKKTPHTVEEQDAIIAELATARNEIKRARRERDRTEEETEEKIDRVLSELRKHLSFGRSIESIFSLRWRVD